MSARQRACVVRHTLDVYSIDRELFLLLAIIEHRLRRRMSFRNMRATVLCLPPSYGDASFFWSGAGGADCECRLSSEERTGSESVREGGGPEAAPPAECEVAPPSPPPPRETRGTRVVPTFAPTVAAGEWKDFCVAVRLFHWRTLEGGTRERQAATSQQQSHAPRTCVRRARVFRAGARVRVPSDSVEPVGGAVETTDARDGPSTHADEKRVARVECRSMPTVE